MAAFPLTKSGFSRLLGAAVTLTCMALPLVPSSPVSAAVQGPLKVDFGPSGTVVPAGYVLDIGGMYTASRGRGWIRQTTSTPVSITANTRDRNKVTDQRLDTLIAMQSSTPARWEAAVQNGIYDVTVAVGDVAFPSGSKHRVTVESPVSSATSCRAPRTRPPRSPAAYASPTARSPSTRPAAAARSSTTSTSSRSPTSSGRARRWPASTSPPPAWSSPTATSTTAARHTRPRRATAGSASRARRRSRSSATAATRDAAKFADQRLDTFMCMQYAGSGGVNQPARWQYALPVGTYDVTVSAGDASFTTGSTHRIAAEGIVAIDNLVPTSSTRFKQATVRVSVTDGFLTLDAAGGTNTKINFVEIVDADNTARTIANVDPANGAASVPTDAVVALTPSHRVDAGDGDQLHGQAPRPGRGPGAGRPRHRHRRGHHVRSERAAGRRCHLHGPDDVRAPRRSGQRLRRIELLVHHRLPDAGDHAVRPRRLPAAERVHADRLLEGPRTGLRAGPWLRLGGAGHDLPGQPGRPGPHPGRPRRPAARHVRDHAGHPDRRLAGRGAVGHLRRDRGRG